MAQTTLGYALRSLRIAHPSVEIAVIDANDRRTLERNQLPERCELFHIAPGDDDVARDVGRGTKIHIFYWRHSPLVRKTVGDRADAFDVHADADLLFLRPMDLASLVPHLEHGRIAMSIDPSWRDYYRIVDTRRAHDGGSVDVGRSSGPMMQAGLIFRNPADDGGLLDSVWERACGVGRRGGLAELPWHDSAFLTDLLTDGGPLWSRLLPLSQDWNFLTDENNHPGSTAYVAHYGGDEVVKALLAQRFQATFSGLGEEEAATYRTV